MAADYGAQGAYKTAQLARYNMREGLKQIDPKAAQYYERYGMTKELDRQVNDRILANINTPVGSKTGFVTGLSRMATSPVRGLIDMAAARTGGALESKIAEGQKKLKADQFAKLLEKKQAAESPTLEAPAGVPANPDVLPVSRPVQLPNAQEEQSQDQTGIALPGQSQTQPKMGMAWKEENTQNRLYDSLAKNLENVWNSTGKADAGGGPASLDNPTFARFVDEVMNQVVDDDNTVNPQKFAKFALQSEPDVQNFEKAFDAWQRVNQDIDVAMKGNVPLGGFEKSNPGSHAGALVSGLATRAFGDPETKNARDSIIQAMQRFTGNPDSASDIERIMVQSSTPEEAKARIFALMAQNNPAAYATLQSLGIME
jgi:hypothetical protein